jgi:hypothetical protein
MEPFWQQLIVGVVVALSLVYLVIRYFKRRRAKGGCANCPTFRTLQNNHVTKPK